MCLTHRRTDQLPLGVKPSFARMANTNCLSRGPAREKEIIMNNRRFPRSMRSQGERPGCGSYVKRVDHGDAFNA